MFLVRHSCRSKKCCKTRFSLQISVPIRPKRVKIVKNIDILLSKCLATLTRPKVRSPVRSCSIAAILAARSACRTTSGTNFGPYLGIEDAQSSQLAEVCKTFLPIFGGRVSAASRPSFASKYHC